jgi:hypothetical protein
METKVTKKDKNLQTCYETLVKLATNARKAGWNQVADAYESSARLLDCAAAASFIIIETKKEAANV